MMSDDSAQGYYARHGLLTHPGDYAPWFDGLPADVPALVRTVQGLMIHIFWAERYGLSLTDQRKAEVNLRTVPQKLRRLLELDDSPLSSARPPERRLVGNCRDFSLLLCAMLQRQGVPARARCGFGAYFLPNHYEDHWVCEYWNADQGRWVLVDAQLDDFQQDVLKQPFDTLDVPRDQFITGGLAWQMIRRGEADPKCFGIFDMHGVAFVRGNVVRDFLALNQIELLPWDMWGWMEDNDQDAAAKDADGVDHMAALSLGGDETFAQVRALYQSDTRLHPPQGWQP